MNNDLGNKDIMARNIRRHMEMLGKDRKEVCRDIGISYTTFTDWVNANTYPRIDRIEQLAKYFGVTKADLVEDQGRSQPVSVKIPVYASVSAGNGCFADGNIETYVEIPEEMAKHGEFFGLRVRGDSMEPDIKDGDIVVARKADVASEGNVVIAVVNGDEGFCKRLSLYAEGLCLVSNNPEYAPKVFSKNEVRTLPVRIVGVVQRLIRDF